MNQSSLFFFFLYFQKKRLTCSSVLHPRACPTAQVATTILHTSSSAQPRTKALLPASFPPLGQLPGSQKDRPPSINDEVCCLKGIFKNGPYHKKLVECNINTVQDFLCHCSNNHEMLRSIIGMPKGAWEKTFRHALEATGTSGILLNGCVKLPAPDQNSFEVTGSSSSQISNVLEQHNDARRLISPECQPPISDMSAMAYRGFESKNIFKTNSITGEEAWEGTEQLDISLEVLMDKNGRSRVPNKFDLSSLLPRYKCLKLLLFVARLKVAALRSRENKFSKISLSSGNADGLNCFYSGDSYWGDLSPFEPWDGWYDLDF